MLPMQNRISLINNQVTPEVILQISTAIERNPNGLRNLNELEKLHLRDLFQSYSSMGEHQVNVNLRHIISQIESRNIVRRMVNAVSSTFRPDPISQKIMETMRTAKAKAEQAKSEKVQAGSHGGRRRSSSSNAAMTPAQLLEIRQRAENLVNEDERKALRQQDLNDAVQALESPEVHSADKESIMLKCKHDFDDFGYRIAAAAKEFGVIPQTNAGKLYVPHNPHEAGSIFRNLKANGIKLQGQRKIDYVNKLEAAYGDLCIALNANLNPNPPKRERRISTRPAPPQGMLQASDAGGESSTSVRRSSRTQQSISEKRAEARTLIEEFSFGQKLYDLISVTTYKVKPGDTWDGIADMFDTPLMFLKLDNDMTTTPKPPIGTTIRIAGSFKTKDVQPEDTWESIAHNNSTSVALLRKFNGLASDSPLPIGGILKIPPQNYI